MTDERWTDPEAERLAALIADNHRRYEAKVDRRDGKLARLRERAREARKHREPAQARPSLLSGVLRSQVGS